MTSVKSKTLPRTPAKRISPVILGLDPGFARVGLAVVAGSPSQPALLSCTTFSTPAGQPRGERLLAVADAVAAAIRRYRPTVAAMEKLFFQTNVRTALAVSEARGVLLLVCARARLPVIEVTPNQVKSAATGNGRADKRAVQKMIGLVFRLRRPITDDDAADAAAIALAVANASHYGA